MNAEIKRHIDAARQVLVGVVPNPTSQIDQITNALVYKFMDDMDQASIKTGGEPSFFVGTLENYAWTRLMDARMGNQERMNLYSEALIKFSESKQLPELFRDIFKSAFLPYRNPEVLALFLKEIAFFEYTHPEDLGDAYEYLLSIMSSQGDAGQFRTPRHIIDFIVDVVNPTKDEKVLDPACGTGGFLVSAYKQILEQHDGVHTDGSKNEEKPLTPDEKKKLMSNFEGYDIDPGMVRIAQVNMYLHQFKNPRIVQYDTLSMEERWKDKFDVILANPPFMSPKGGVSTHNKFSISSTRSEVLFVDYIMNHLRPNGRAGIIVPEGIIFQSGTAYKSLRKNLVEDGLCAVVSLPSGVFNPYAGVKTSILLFDNVLAKQSKEILFVKVTHDGFELGAQRRPSNKNDLPEVLEILRKWKLGEKMENEKAVWVEKAVIGESGDYNLSGDRYRVATDYSNAKWEMVELGDVCELNRGVVYSKKDEVAKDGFKILRANNISLEGKLILEDVKQISRELKLKENHRLRKNDIFICLASGSSNHIGKVAFIENSTDFFFGGFMGSVRVKVETINSKYLFYLLRDEKFNTFLGQEISGANINNLNSSIFGRYKIPLPPLEIQQQIVAELDGYQKIIDGARMVVENWKPRIDIDPEWERVKLGEVCEITSSKRIFQEEYVSSGIPFYRTKEIVELSRGKDISLELFISQERFIEIKNNFGAPAEGDILISAVGTIGVSWIISDNREFYFKDGNLLWLRKFIGVDVKFIKLMLDINVADNLHLLTNGAAYNALTIVKLKELLIPLPSLEIQKKIVEGIESEQALVESAKKLIGIYEGKMGEVISKLWSE